MVDNTLYNMLGENEEVLWSGKPNLKCFILESIFNPLLPFAIVWALFDGFFIGAIFHKGGPAAQTPFLPVMLIGFFALHLMPVWIYLGGVLFSFLKYKHTKFLVTEKGVYVSGGFFSRTYQHKSFAELAPVSVRRGMIDQFLGVGDVIFTTHLDNYRARQTNPMRQEISICDVPDYQEVYALIKDLQQKAHFS